MEEKQLQIWDLWFPKAAATGMSFARGRMDPTDILYVHAAPDSINVEVRMSDGTFVARGENLKRTLPHYSPITKLICKGSQIEREDVWPTENDLNKPVVLPGGEVGIIRGWWHAPDHSEWRWQVEFYNHK